ncbi:MAG: sensor histidine kinase, partial [Spirochaetota bacterium]
TAILLFAGTLFNGRTMVLACTVSLAALVVMLLRWPNDNGGEQPALIAVSYFAAIVPVLLWSRLSSRLIARATGEAALARESRAHAHALVENQKVLNQELEHRVKNNLQMLISIINLELDKLPPGQTRAALLATQTRVQAIALLHEILFGPIYGSRKGLVPYFEALAAHVISAYSDVEVGLEVELSVSDVQPDPDTLLPLAIVVNELLTNAVVHGALTAGERRVGLRMYRSDRGTPEDTFFVTEIWDRGPGFSGEFDSADAKTLGLNLVASLVESLGGSFEIRNEAPGARAVVVISCSRLSTAWAVSNDADG